MTGRIITARHGRPNLSRQTRISARQYGEWWARYDESGLHPDEAPPPDLIELASRAKTIISSNLPRAMETARQLTRGARETPADPLFVEAALPPPPIPIMSLTPGQWGVLSRLFWLLGYAPNGIEGHRAAWARVDDIVARLSSLAGDGDVLLCAHGYLNWMIDKTLRRSGWRLAGRNLGNRYWSWRVYEPARAAVVQRAPVVAE
jgi:broad specificity phosphatase PhoE